MRTVLPDFKSQIQMDVKHVFLNPAEFGVLKRIRYYAGGYYPGQEGKEPLDLTIPVVMETEGTYVSKWDKNSQRARAGSTTVYNKSDVALFQNQAIFYCALEDFGQLPKKGRRLELDGRLGKINAVTEDNGMLTITLTEFDD